MAEDWVKDVRSEAKVEFNTQSEIEKKVGTLKEDQAKLSEQLKEAVRARAVLKQVLRMLRSKLKNNANSCTITKLIWQQRSNW